MYEIKLEQFSGPLNKLLELIEAKKLEITEVSLAAVTADFIGFVEKLEKEKGVEPGVLADFIVIAARLLLIKSKVLLPNLELTEEEKVDVADLEQRLKIYREFSAKGRSASGGLTASQQILALWNQKNLSFSRPLLSALGDFTSRSFAHAQDDGNKNIQVDGQHRHSERSEESKNGFFYPPKGVTEKRLEDAMRSILAVLEALIPETHKIKVAVITLQEKIAELTKRLEQASSFAFKGFSKSRDRKEVVVLFLAVLHMLSNRLAEAEQDGAFGEIIVRKNGVTA